MPFVQPLRLSLRLRLMVLVAAALLPLGALSVWSALTASNEAEAQAADQLELAASLVAAYQDRLAESARHLLTAVSGVPSIRTLDPARCQRYFEVLQGRNPIYGNIGILDAQGRLVCHAAGDRAVFEAADRDYFIDALKNQRFSMGALTVGRAVRRHVVPFALPVVVDGQVQAVAFATVDVVQMEAELYQLNLPPGLRLSVIDEQARVLAARDASGVSLGEPGRKVRVPRLVEAAKAMKAGAFKDLDRDGRPRLFAFVPSRAVGGRSLMAVASLDQATLTDSVWSRTRRELSLLAAMLLAGLVAAWAVGSRMVTGPAGRLVQAAQALARGDLSHRLPLPPARQRDEFAHIAEALNLAGASLQLRQSQLEAELRNSRHAFALLDQVINRMQEGVIAATLDGHFLLRNEAARSVYTGPGDVLPAERASAYGLHVEDGSRLLSVDELPLVRAVRGEAGHMVMCVRTGAGDEGRLLHCSFQPLPLQDAEPAGLLVFTDITALRQGERANARLVRELAELNQGLEKRIADRTADLAREEARYRTLAEQAPEIIWNADGDGWVSYFNPAMTGLVGGRPENWMGFAWMDCVHPEDLPIVMAAWQRAVETVRPFSGTRRLRGRDGRWHTTQFRVAPVPGPVGAAPTWVGIDTDITELKAVEDALRQSNRELEAFSYSVSHDLRAPLAAVGGFARALSERLAGHEDAKAQHFLARIRAGASLMDELIEGLLLLAQVVRQPLDWGPVDLTSLARDTLEWLHMQDPGREVRITVQEGMATHGDARLLRTVLQNLLGNAWKFTARSEAAAIEVGRMELDGPVYFVRDNGAGFDMAHAQRLFSPFQRLHSAGEFPGTGIGLATVQRVIARHGGRIWAEAARGQGCTMFFTLAEAAPLDVLRGGQHEGQGG